MTDFFGQRRPWLVAGPCSAESEDQMMRTASGLAACGVSVFRAGLWKPRTRPGCFEGVGESGIAWLLRVRSEFGMRVCTEVACASHVGKCLDSGIDMVWIGARTTTNPFLVQEIASALEGSDVPVLVKNPVNEDINLWEGAVERLRKSGISRIGLVLRGFSHFGKGVYRNIPGWHAAAQMKQAFPDLPILCDPSHISGDASLVGELSQRALDLGLDGLMLESHFSPENALSDSGQQLTPEALGALLGSLKVRMPNPADAGLEARMAGLRSGIDDLDDELLRILGSRMELCREIGRCKKDGGMSILQPVRWDGVIRGAVERGSLYGLDSEFVVNLYNIIHSASIAEQNVILENDSEN